MIHSPLFVNQNSCCCPELAPELEFLDNLNVRSLSHACLFSKRGLVKYICV